MCVCLIRDQNFVECIRIYLPNNIMQRSVQPRMFAVHGPFCSHLSQVNLCQILHCIVVILDTVPLFLLLNTIIALSVLYNYDTVPDLLLLNSCTLPLVLL